jgi:hypothetical protein
MPGRFGIDRVMLFSVGVGASRAENIKSLTSLADTQLQLGGNLIKFLSSISSEAEMDELAKVMHFDTMDPQFWEQKLLPRVQEKCGSRRVSATCVQDPANADISLYCAVIHES